MSTVAATAGVATCSTACAPHGSPGAAPDAGLLLHPAHCGGDQAEADLGLALVADVGGTRPNVTVAQVRRLLRNQFQVEEARIQLYHPEDFLIMFRTEVELSQVFHTPYPKDNPFHLIFKRWRRQLMASTGPLEFHVLIEIRNLPAHVWNLDTVASMLSSSCTDLKPTPETLSGSDLRHFRLLAWTPDPELIPIGKILVVPEPRKLVGGAPLSLKPEEMMYSDLPAFYYNIDIDVLQVQDWRRQPGWSSGEDSPPDSGRHDSEDPDDDEDGRGPGDGDLFCPERPVVTQFPPSSGEGPAILPAGDRHGRDDGGPTMRGAPVSGPHQESLAACSKEPSRASNGSLANGQGNPLPGGTWQHTSSQGQPDGRQCIDDSIHLCGQLVVGRQPVGASCLPDPMLLESEIRVEGRKTGALMEQGASVAASEDTGSEQGLLFAADGPLLANTEDIANGLPASLQDTADGLVLGEAQNPSLGRSSDGQPTQALRAMQHLTPHLRPSLELVRFADVSPVQPSPGLNNVNTIRGSLPVQPLQISPVTTVEEFVAAVSKPCEQPLLPSTPPHRRPRPVEARGDNTALPRRSKRLATKIRVSNPTTQAQNVLMSKWGITSEARSPNADALVEYYNTYVTPLSSGHRRAIRRLFKAAADVAPPLVEDEH